MRRLAFAAIVVLSTACSAPETPRPFGFTRASGEQLRSIERALVDRADPNRVRDSHRELTRQIHPAGSPRDRELADWIARLYKEAGLDDVHISTHEVLLPRPLDLSISRTEPEVWRAQVQEGIDGGPGPGSPSARELLPYHAFSASGEVEAPVVYAGPGERADYEWLASQAIDVKGRIVVVHFDGAYRYRGMAAYTAQQFGAAAILMFRLRDPDYHPSVPGMDAVAMNGIERGSILYDFFYPGDPETPGWPSLAGARRLPREQLPTLPRIVSVPVSAVTAESLLLTLGGPSAPKRWGYVAMRSRVGPSSTPVQVKVRNDDAIRPVWTVTGMLRGSDDPDSVVIVGNHRDAWAFGGVDPSTGTAAMLEMVRVLGALRREGWKPKRSLLFASWDAEEFGLTSSTEWAEEHRDWLRDHAVAYVNIDSAASGSRFVAGASPSLMQVIADAADAVRDPGASISVASAERNLDAAGRGTTRDGPNAVVADRLGGGSDYSVFLNHLGVPSADLAFGKSDPMYHTLFDTHDYVDRLADPGFRYTTTIARVAGIAALRLASADSIPIDPAAAAASIDGFLRELRPRVPGTPLRDVESALADFTRSARTFAATRDAALDAGDSRTLASLDRRLLRLERAFVDDAGLPGREWYRHVLMAPARSYQPLVLPGLAEALEFPGISQFPGQSARLSAALRRAADVLDGR
jgi:N-acetylated-alpha-linked acidic dipeptidase